MRFYKKIYMSPSLAKKRKRILWKLRTGRPQPTIYIITLATNNDLFEIYHSGMFKQKYYRERKNVPYIIGIAEGYYGAIDLVTDMLEDVFAATGCYNVKAFFAN